MMVLVMMQGSGTVVDLFFFLVTRRSSRLERSLVE